MRYFLTFSFGLFLFIVLVSSCQTTKQIHEEALYGKYQWHGTYGIASNIKLKIDNSFIFNWQIGLMNGETVGTWKVQNNLLILNSEKQGRKEETFVVKKNIVSDSSFYILKIVDDENEPMYGANCVYSYEANFVSGSSSNLQGIIKIPVSLVFDKLTFSYLGYNDIEVLKSDLIGTSCTISLLDFTDYYHFFINEKWKIKYGKLIDPGIELDRYTKRNYYERIME